MSELAEIYIDESGSTGMDLGNTDQPNLMLAAPLIPADVEASFWTHAMNAWNSASDLLGVPVDSIELKGSELYGGKGKFKDIGSEDRLHRGPRPRGIGGGRPFPIRTLNYRSHLREAEG